MPVAKRLMDTLMCSGSEAGSYLRLIDSCITQLMDRLQVPADRIDSFERRPLHRGANPETRNPAVSYERGTPVIRDTTPHLHRGTPSSLTGVPRS